MLSIGDAKNFVDHTMLWKIHHTSPELRTAAGEFPRHHYCSIDTVGVKY